MAMINCWEAKNCGREPGGSKVSEFGVCPAATETKLDGYHNGTNAGRVCWAVAGTYCGGKVQGTFANKEENCSACDFYKDVIKAEGKNYTGVMPILKKLKS
ncbi:MAG: two-CW domain-containing protein [Deltaproteobacteria bacterium]